MSKKDFAPTKVLYEFDGPAIFISDEAFAKYLFLKIDEDIDQDDFLVTPISDEHESALENDQISLRGVFLDAEELWVVTLDNDHQMTSHAAVSGEDSLRFLPEQGVGLNPDFDSLPDTLIPENAILTVYLKGNAFREGIIGLNKFQQYLKETSKVLKRALVPSSLTGRRGSTFDFLVTPVKLGSFSLSVIDTKFSVKKINRGNQDKKLTGEEIQASILNERNLFIEMLDKFQREIEDENFFNADYIPLFDLLEDILPSENDDISSLSFISRHGNEKSVTITKAKSEKIRDTYSRNDKGFVTLAGFIEAMNDDYHWIRLKAADGRKTKCDFSDTDFDDLKSQDLFRIGSHATVKGQLFLRSKVDRLEHADLTRLSKLAPR